MIKKQFQINYKMKTKEIKKKEYEDEKILFLGVCPFCKRKYPKECIGNCK